ncbi:DUF692 domain-containing protein [Wolbachia endosymbiont (group A) of Anoplius nigerrimus]|nr:DUF692 domain-containing protein [Wolbachia endosymbiont (group A) of Anoplius nigerrimus]
MASLKFCPQSLALLLSFLPIPYTQDAVAYIC